tara:strand:+ start:1639 stop:1839 length:201 start_codon:yes stop_codon:yes gene_type:complete
MENYNNLRNTKHTLTIKNRKTKDLILKKTFKTESDAFNYLEEVRSFKNNSETLSFHIVGANCIYFC